jgi:hypothetical protein
MGDNPFVAATISSERIICEATSTKASQCAAGHRWRPLHHLRKGADETFKYADTVHPSTHLNALCAKFVEQQIDGRRRKKR